MHKTGQLRSFFLILLVLSFILPDVTGIGTASAASQSPKSAKSGSSSIKYTYDAAGRLISVATPNNGTASYTYDSVGNLLSVSRDATANTSSANPPSSNAPGLQTPHISGFTPTSGASGIYVTLRGANFSPVLAENVVKVGGLDAEVTSAQPTQLVAIVPPGAKSGPVSVTTPAGTDTSATPFSVRSAAQPGQDPPVAPLPPLRAASGVTALAGRVLQLDGHPLAGVDLSIGSRHTFSDATGRFLLQNVPAGHQALLINGDQIPAGPFGLFQEAVDLQSGKTTVLPWNTWLPRLDLKHAVHFPSPTRKKVVITNPSMPGFEAIIEPGTVIKDYWGHVVTEVSLTPIPITQAPFPLAPGMPIYYTLQPGLAWVTQGPGFKIIYPNVTNQPPGAHIPFVSNSAGDPGLGWSLAGYGTVSQNGSQILPTYLKNPYNTLQPFGVTFQPNCSSPELCPPAGGNNPNDGEPVDLASGAFIYQNTDLTLPDVLPLSLTRIYHQSDPNIRDFGMGMSDPFDLFITPGQQSGTLALNFPNGASITYTPANSPGTYQTLTTPTAFYDSTLVEINDATYTITLTDGTEYAFGSKIASLVSIIDRFGNTLSINRDSVTGHILQVTSPSGRWISFTYAICVPGQTPSYCITQAQDNMGRTVSYAYDANGRMTSVTDVAGQVTNYAWAACSSSLLCSEMVSIQDPRKITYLTNAFDPSSGRVTQQTLADGSTYQFAYTVNQNQQVTETDVTDPRLNIRKVLFDSNDYVTSDTNAAGTPVQQVTTYMRDPNSELILSTTDALNRTTSYTYDSFGNVTSITYLTGSKQQETWTYTYEPVFNRLASVTDPLKHTTMLTYDDPDQKITITDPLNHQTVITLVGGQPVEIVDPLGHTMYFSYFDGELVAIADPLKRITTGYYDSGGRLLQVTDPLGKTTKITYDNFNDVTKVTDPLNHTTTIGYDPDGDITSVKDANGNLTQYTYDSRDRLITSKDALKNSTIYAYDGMSNLTQVTDRNGVNTTFGYDALNRETSVTYAGNGGTISYTYDAGNRLISTVDSLTGTYSDSYDGLNSLTSETSPNGKVSYQYDAAERRTQMTVAGQQPVHYTYNNDNQLLSLTQGSSSVGMSYNKDGNPTSIVLPDAVKEKYTYDAAYETTAIAYVYGKNTLGNLTYTYDKDGRVSSMGGSFARTGLPTAISSASYNADNELTSLNGTSLSYDKDGNLLNDGTNTYTWNSRQQLTAIAGPNLTASFAYDPFGRRSQKTINGTSTSFLYDGSNVVQELSSGTPSANLLTGLGVDQIFARTDSTGTSSFLTDRLGSTIALANSSGSVQTSYTYDPYGNTTVSGSPSTNAFQYTGRENDGTGLYYIRARYYSPGQQRFISQDPLGFNGGSSDLYSYVGGDPVNFIDPTGTTYGFGAYFFGGLTAFGFALFSPAEAGAGAAALAFLAITYATDNGDAWFQALFPPPPPGTPPPPPLPPPPPPGEPFPPIPTPPPGGSGNGCPGNHHQPNPPDGTWT